MKFQCSRDLHKKNINNLQQLGFEFSKNVDVIQLQFLHTYFNTDFTALHARF